MIFQSSMGARKLRFDVPNGITQGWAYPTLQTHSNFLRMCLTLSIMKRSFMLLKFVVLEPLDNKW
jgi:hypothetical protein